MEKLLQGKVKAAGCPQRQFAVDPVLQGQLVKSRKGRVEQLQPVIEGALVLQYPQQLQGAVDQGCIS